MLLILAAWADYAVRVEALEDARENFLDHIGEVYSSDAWTSGEDIYNDTPTDLIESSFADVKLSLSELFPEMDTAEMQYMSPKQVEAEFKALKKSAKNADRVELFRVIYEGGVTFVD